MELSLPGLLKAFLSSSSVCFPALFLNSFHGRNFSVFFLLRSGKPGSGSWYWRKYLSSFHKWFFDNAPTLGKCALDRFTKTFFWNFQNIQAVLCYILIEKQMLEKAFCSNIAPSLSSGTHLFYKAEYMGRSYLNQVWGITFDWSALAT